MHWRTKNQISVGEGFSQLVQDHDFKQRKTLILGTFHATLQDTHRQGLKKKNLESQLVLWASILAYLREWFHWKMTCLDPIGQVSFKSFLPSKKIYLSLTARRDVFHLWHLHSQNFKLCHHLGTEMYGRLLCQFCNFTCEISRQS